MWQHCIVVTQWVYHTTTCWLTTLPSYRRTGPACWIIQQKTSTHFKRRAITLISHSKQRAVTLISHFSQSGMCGNPVSTTHFPTNLASYIRAQRFRPNIYGAYLCTTWMGMITHKIDKSVCTSSDIRYGCESHIVDYMILAASPRHACGWKRVNF